MSEEILQVFRNLLVNGGVLTVEDFQTVFMTVLEYDRSQGQGDIGHDLREKETKEP